MARKILLADDSVTAQNMGRKILADAGYEVITVNNGSAALKKINEQKPDLIVLDVYMPGYSGLEVCQRLKEVGETSRIPILLTVGKLEPFKPEEVKRVRADGFIVKPFEASELLSALSKLEDRIVPRSEPSKPGRFARATAAIDEGRYDKTVAIEEDSSWKNRIAFPSKKKGKEKEVEPEADEPAAYTPANKDLRSVIEHKLAETPGNGKTGDRVDLGALAPVGLPKDVTPEEIAALAAAAAQMQGKIAESRVSERAPDTVPIPEAIETAKESRQEVRSESQQEVSASTATFAEQKPQEPAEAKLAEATLSSSLANSGNGSGPHVASPEPAADEPVTIAVGGPTAETAPGTSRWTAVPVALSPEDAAISLEQEMQKAYAAFAAAETGHAGSVANFRESEPAAKNQNSTKVENVSPDPVVQVPASEAPEVAQTLTAVANAATDAMSAAAEKLEAVADSYVEPKEPAAPVAPEPAAATSVEAAAQTPVEPQSEAVKAENANVPAAAQSVPEDSGDEESKDDESHADIPSVGLAGIPVESADASISASTEHASEGTAESARATVGKESDIAATTAAAWATWRSNRESGHPDSAVESTSAQEIVAKAVAAGAEGSTAEVSADAASDPSIASIVDSMLADLRPKIVEEISRKLGKKK